MLLKRPGVYFCISKSDKILYIGRCEDLLIHLHPKQKPNMKAELKAKFLQHLTQKKKDEGFTPVELLLVIIIIEILPNVSLPSFLKQAPTPTTIELTPTATKGLDQLAAVWGISRSELCEQLGRGVFRLVKVHEAKDNPISFTVQAPFPILRRIEGDVNCN